MEYYADLKEGVITIEYDNIHIKVDELDYTPVWNQNHEDWYIKLDSHVSKIWDNELEEWKDYKLDSKEVWEVEMAIRDEFNWDDFMDRD